MSRSEPQTFPAMIDCPHCRSQIPNGSLRCARCGGEIRWCPKCEQPVPVRITQQWKGVFRGSQQMIRCARCNRLLEGSRW